MKQAPFQIWERLAVRESSFHATATMCLLYNKRAIP